MRGEGDCCVENSCADGQGCRELSQGHRNPSEFELEQLLESDDYRGAVIEEDDLTDLEWIHDDVEIEVMP